MTEVVQSPVTPESLEIRSWRPDWADAGVFLFALASGVPIGMILARYDGEPSSAEMIVATGCVNLLFVSGPFTFVRWLIYRSNRKKGVAAKPRVPLPAFLLGSVLVAGISGMGLVGGLSIRIQAAAAMQSDVEQLKAAALAGNPLPDLNPDDPKYGPGQPLMKFMLGKLRPYTENARAIRDLKEKVGTPLQPPAVFDPAKVLTNTKLIQELHDRVLVLRDQLEGFAGASGMAELERLEMPTGFKRGFQHSMKQQEASYVRAKASLEASGKVYEQIQKVLIFLHQHPPTEQGGKLRFASREESATYLAECETLNKLLSEENRLSAPEPTKGNQ